MSSVLRTRPMPAHVVELSTLRIESAACIGVVGGKRCRHLRNGQVISIKPRGIEQYLVLHGRAAESGIVGHAMHRSVGSLDDPIFNASSVPAGCDRDSRSHSDIPVRWD